MRVPVWSKRAIRQYAAAFAFLAERNPVAADKLRLQVRGTVARLAERPTGRPGYAADTFETIISKTSYLLVYELAGDELRILRLFHMSQDWRGWRDVERDAQ